MIQLKLTIEEIDYDSVAEFLAPAFADQTANGNIPAWARLLLVGGGATGDTIRKMLSKVPDSTKEDMIVQAVNFRTERTAEKLEDIAAGKGIRIKIKDVGARRF